MFAIAFADASFLPMPTPIFFIGLSILYPPKTYKYALFGILGTFSGAFLGYAIGHFAWLTASGDFTSFASFLMNNIPGFSETLFNNIQAQFLKWDFWILLVASLLPIPYKIFSISSGVFDMNIILFAVTTLLAQAVKFYLLAYLTIKIGVDVKKIVDFKYKPLAVVASLGIIALAIIAIKTF